MIFKFLKKLFKVDPNFTWNNEFNNETPEWIPLKFAEDFKKEDGYNFIPLTYEVYFKERLTQMLLMGKDKP